MATQQKSSIPDVLRQTMQKAINATTPATTTAPPGYQSKATTTSPDVQQEESIYSRISSAFPELFNILTGGVKGFASSTADILSKTANLASRNQTPPPNILPDGSTTPPLGASTTETDFGTRIGSYIDNLPSPPSYTPYPTSIFSGLADRGREVSQDLTRLSNQRADLGATMAQEQFRGQNVINDIAKSVNEAFGNNQALNMQANEARMGVLLGRDQLINDFMNDDRFKNADGTVNLPGVFAATEQALQTRATAAANLIDLRDTARGTIDNMIKSGVVGYENAMRGLEYLDQSIANQMNTVLTMYDMDRQMADTALSAIDAENQFKQADFQNQLAGLENILKLESIREEAKQDDPAIQQNAIVDLMKFKGTELEQIPGLRKVYESFNEQLPSLVQQYTSAGYSPEIVGQLIQDDKEVAVRRATQQVSELLSEARKELADKAPLLMARQTEKKQLEEWLQKPEPERPASTNMIGATGATYVLSQQDTAQAQRKIAELTQDINQTVTADGEIFELNAAVEALEDKLNQLT